MQLASEAVPFAKTGGLGDVVGALTRHLGAAGHQADLILPYYRVIAEMERVDDRPPAVRFSPSELGTAGEGRLLSGPELDGARTWFVDVPELFDRDGLYGAGGANHPDNLLRFAAFVRAALLASERLDLAPHVVHCHDWQTALAPAWLAGSDVAPTVFTIHNLAYQGWFAAADRMSADVAPGAGPRLPGAGDLHLLRVGLTSADQVTTVSPTYASEILKPEFGFGLDELLRGLEPPVVGILNGIDTDVWNPADDPYLPEGWQVGDLAGKRSARTVLAETFGIDAPSGIPVFGLVSRLVEQKGLGLLEELRPRIAGWRNARFVLLGTGEPRYERLLEELSEFPHVGARVAFDERLAHIVEGGSDFFLMPSKFEPCGLNQMISQRYGTLPIVHHTGGLADTVTSVDARTIADGSATGIVFAHFDAAGLQWAIEEAMRLYADPASYTAVQAAAMRLDHSWNARIAAYESLYERVRAAPAANRDTAN